MSAAAFAVKVCCVVFDAWDEYRYFPLTANAAALNDVILIKSRLVFDILL
jgi:multidrug resistance efflux pump